MYRQPPRIVSRHQLFARALAGLLLLSTRASADETLRFVDVTESAGVAFTHGYRLPIVSEDGSFDEPRHFAGGVAAGDVDRDGWVDLYAIRGDIGANALFRNRGDGTFEEVAARAGVAVAGEAGAGPLLADLDGDGWLDLFVGGVRGSRPKVFRNLGAGTFADVTVTAGLVMTRDTYSAAAGDYDGDGDLDLAVGHWNSLLQPGASNEGLWRNDGDFHFTDLSLDSGLSAILLGDHAFVWDVTFTPTFADVDRDGRPELLLTSDFGTTRILRRTPEGSWTDITDRRVITDENGMGAAVGDYDNDGLLDWFVSSIWDPQGATLEHWGVTGNRLYRGRGDGGFDDVTDTAGVRVGYWGWAASWGDYDNDGWLDLVQTNGFGRSADYVPTARFFADPTRLFLSNRDGTFREVAADVGLVDQGLGRGLVNIDYDRDGDLDVFVSANSGPARLFRNDGGSVGHWLDVRLHGGGANSEAIGARVEIEAGGSRQLREIRAGNNFESAEPALAHFGVADAPGEVRLLVTWPSGRQTQVLTTAVDRQLELAEVVLDTPTPTATPTDSPIPSPTVAVSATPTAVSPCVGDCDGSNAVTVDEIVRAVAIALGTVGVEACRRVDRDEDGAVTVDEVLAAVNLALQGCPAAKFLVD